MIPITYLKGDATEPKCEGNKIICHICNDIGAWGAGFVLAISKKWKDPEQCYKMAFENSKKDLPLGTVQFVDVENDLVVANMIGQHGIKTGCLGPPIRYKSVEECLGIVSREAKSKSASVHMPRIGCGLAGGSWKIIGPIVEKTLSANDVAVFVYDF